METYKHQTCEVDGCLEAHPNQLESWVVELTYKMIGVTPKANITSQMSMAWFKN